MQSDRLTRQELTWLLTQEARSAAEKLRKGVATMSTPEIEGLAAPTSPSVETELDALDDAMKMLATLHTGGATRSRRGRIDLAALLWEVAPNARVSIEPGSGTEVFGDESDLRRMFQVLVGSTNPASAGSEMGTPELSIRREGPEIRVSVMLGPDSSANAGTERAWLSRMATRYGGRLELEGATEAILLPADGNQREVSDLRRELEAAQRQGEAYARELAAVFSYSESPPPRFPSQAPESQRPLGPLCAMAGGMAAELRRILSLFERAFAALREVNGPVSDALVEATTLGSQMVADLVKLSQCPVHESVQHVNMADAVRSAMGELESRATRRGVTLKSRIPAHVDVDSKPLAATLLARTLINDAIQATPRGGQVTVSLESAPKGAPSLVVTDDGPVIPEDAFAALLSARQDPSTVGRPSTIALFWAQTLAQHLGSQLELGRGDAAARSARDGQRPGASIEVKFP